MLIYQWQTTILVVTIEHLYKYSNVLINNIIIKVPAGITNVYCYLYIREYIYKNNDLDDTKLL